MGATFDRSRKYRLHLWRQWDTGKGTCCFIMLNPSTADDTKNDPTITRCINFARSWGYQRLDVVNLFSFRAVTPQELFRNNDPVGKNTDEVILRVADTADCVVAAWGNHGLHDERAQKVVRMLNGQAMSCFGLTKLNQPRHPLYVRNDIELTPYGALH